MRKICLIGLCVFALCGRANAAVSGFESAVSPILGITVDNAFCNDCVRWLQCGATWAYSQLLSAGCGNLDVMSNGNVEAAEIACRAQVPGAASVSQVSSLLPLGMEKGAMWYDEFVCVYGGGGPNEEYVRQREMAVAMVKHCMDIGACMCGAGKYLQPIGVELLKWGTNSKCLQCPSGGTSRDDSNNVFITSCYIASGGSFSDDTGSGTVTNDCPYVADGNVLDSIY